MSTSATAPGRFIDPKVLASLGRLDLIAKTVVEGFVNGLHKSPFHGFSLEFLEYRQYTPGDDIRQVDWKLYGRTDRHYVKQYEGETNTQVYLLIDTSRSMAFTSHQVSKIDYSRYLAASLAYLCFKQKDAVGLVSFSDQIQAYLPARIRRGHLINILTSLEDIETGGQTDVASSLNQFSGWIRKRSLVILISDFYQDVQQLRKSLRFFHHRGNDVILFHILDPMELELPITGISTLEDMETGEQIPFSDQSRQAYLRELRSHLDQIRQESLSVHIDHVILNTEKPLDRALARYFTARVRRA